MSTKNKTLLLKVISGFLLLVILIANIKRAMNGELFTYDYGIYQQGVFELASGTLNPFMSVRDIKLWNDHFMPILFLAVPWVWLWGFSTVAMIAFEWLWFAIAALVTFSLVRNKKIEVQVISLIFLLFAKGILSGLHFAIHPGVWSAPVWILLCYNLAKERWKSVLLYSFCLIFFRESFTFGIITLTTMMAILDKERKRSLALLLFCLAYALFVFVLRKHVLGPVEDFGGKFVSNLLSRPFGTLVDAFKIFEWKIFFKIYYPYFIPVPMALLFLWRQGTKGRQILLLFVALIGPHYFLHFLANKFHYQYGVAAVCPLLGLLYGTDYFERIRSNKKLFYFILILPILSGMGFHTKFMKLIFKKYPNGSRVFSEIYEEKDKMRDILQSLPKDKKIIGPSRATATLYQPGMTNLYTVESFLKRDKVYDYLFYWKGQGYAHNGVTVEKKKIMDQFCGESISKVIYESDVFYLAEGVFDQDCYEYNYP